MRHAFRGGILSLASLAILGSAALHGLVNVPHLHEDLLDIGVRPTLLGTVMLVLYFSVVAMFVFGALVLSSAVRSFRGGNPQAATLWIIAASYMAFGLAAFVLVNRSPHMLGYAGMGLLVAVGAALGRMQGSRRVQGAV
jgi:hypothetical protein